MDITILIPHFKNYKATAYSVNQFLKYSEGHNTRIIVINNSFPDKSIEGLAPFFGKIDVLINNSDKISSHGIAYDMAMPFVETEYVLCAESDSFPTSPDWISYYENLMNQDVDVAGSILVLSGGCYLHPAGALYKKSVWEEADKYFKSCQYSYFPNMSMKQGFACHLMVHDSIKDKFLENPEDYIELANGYKPYSKELALERLEFYRPTVGGFHNGMGKIQESIKTYGQRTFDIDVPNILLDNNQKLIHRIGYEPGQAICYFSFATNKTVVSIPTEVKWLKGREGQQQEYTINEAGFKHIWAGSSFLDMKGTDMNDVYEFKKNQIEELYNSLPEKLKVANV